MTDRLNQAQREKFEREKNRALKISKTSQIYSDENLIDQIIYVARLLGKTPSEKGWNSLNRQGKEGICAAALITRRFGSWSQAIEKAGLRPNNGTEIGHSERFSRKNIARLLWELSEANGNPVSMAGYELYKNENKHLKLPTVALIRSKFGSWINALEYAFTGDWDG